MKPNITEDPTLSSYADSPAILAQVARAKAILAKHPLPAQILEAQAAKAKAAELCETLKQHRQRHHLTQTELADKVGLMTIANRLSELNEKYIKTCLDTNNPLITKLVKEYGNKFQSTNENKSSPLSNMALF